MKTLKKPIVVATIVALLAFASLSCNKSASESPAPVKQAIPSGAEVECPVCGLKFKQSESAAQTTYNGNTYYFFLEDHKNEFTLNPDKYLRKDTEEDETERQGTDKTGERTR